MSDTPKLWNYNGYDDHCDVGRKYHEITDEYGFEVINQNGIVDGEKAGAVHGRLIAAAPELLEACKAALSLVEPLFRPSSDPHETIIQIRAAIAKAKGE